MEQLIRGLLSRSHEMDLLIICLQSRSHEMELLIIGIKSRSHEMELLIIGLQSRAHVYKNTKKCIFPKKGHVKKTRDGFGWGILPLWTRLVLSHATPSSPLVPLNVTTPSPWVRPTLNHYWDTKLWPCGGTT